MNLEYIRKLQEKPAPFTPGEPLFWDDPHISTQMLKAHLNPDNDLASRRPQTIQKSVDWLTASLDLQTGDSVIDLGCGPGLYASRLAEHGLRVPQDVALVCFNATQESAYNVPSLTAVRQPVDKMARAAIDMLKNWDGKVRRVEFEFYLRVGESCGCQGHEVQPETR